MQERTKSITLVGCFLSMFGLLLIAAFTNLPFLANTISEQTISVLGLILVWLLTFLLLAIIKFGEKRTFSSIGLKSITMKEVLLALGIGIVLSIAVPLLTLLVSQILPSTGGDIEEVTTTTNWRLLLFSVLTAGISEEIIFRGYLLERLNEITSKKTLGAIVSVAAFILPHLLSWNLAHVVGVVIPLGVLLTLIYLWKRNLLFNIIIHIMIDLPLVVMALMVA